MLLLYNKIKKEEINLKNFLPNMHKREITDKIVPKMRYDEKQDFFEWQKKAEQKLRVLLGMDKLERCDDCLEIEYDVMRDDFREIRFTFQSEPGYFVPCHLLIPKTLTESAPVVICLQGHSTGMHISLGRYKYENDNNLIEDGSRLFALQAVEHGLCALTIEQRGFGECGGKGKDGPNCHISSAAALLIGRTTVGERVWDVSRSIDILEKHFSQADISQLICMGNSGGGTTTFYAACIDKRIQIAVPSCSVCSFDDSIIAMEHCICNFVPNIRLSFDMGDLAGLIAPRKLILVCGNQDPIFPLKGVVKSYEVIQKLFQKAGTGDNCSLIIGEGAHRFYPEDTWPVIMKALKM